MERTGQRVKNRNSTWPCPWGAKSLQGSQTEPAEMQPHLEALLRHLRRSRQSLSCRSPAVRLGPAPLGACFCTCKWGAQRLPGKVAGGFEILCAGHPPSSWPAPGGGEGGHSIWKALRGQRRIRAPSLAVGEAGGPAARARVVRTGSAGGQPPGRLMPRFPYNRGVKGLKSSGSTVREALELLGTAWAGAHKGLGQEFGTLSVSPIRSASCEPPGSLWGFFAVWRHPAAVIRNYRRCSRGCRPKTGRGGSRKGAKNAQSG